MEKLPTIVLFQADFNHNNKFLGKEIMKHTIPQKKIAQENVALQGKRVCIRP